MSPTLVVLKGTLKIGQARLPRGTVLSVENFAALGTAEVQRLTCQGWIGEPSQPEQKQAPAEKRGSGSGPWNLDPAQLAGKDLDTLKVMVRERDSKFPLDEITEAEEAVAQLSKDFAGTSIQIARAAG